MVSKNDPGEVYFIHTINQKSGKSHGYYKIGIVRNERDSAERIKEHQTGNPHRIVPYKIMKTNAPMLIEGMLHATYSEHQVSTEWFKFEDKKIEEVIAEAERLDKEHGQSVAEMSKHYAIPASKPVLRLTGDKLKKAKKLTENAFVIEKELKMHYYLMKEAEHELKTLTDNHQRGIQGVSYVTITGKKNEFNLSKWWNLASDAQKKKAGLENKPKNDFVLLYSQNDHKKAGDAYWKNLHPKESRDEEKAKEKLPNHKPRDFQDSAIPRTAKIHQLHHTYVERTGKHNRKKKELEAVIIQLMVMCGQHEGIEEICSWKREKKDGLKVNGSLMKKHFANDLTDQKFFKETEAKAVISVYPFRPYA